MKQEKQAFICGLELKSLSSEGRFAGYGSVFGVVDNQKDIIERGAFRQSLLQEGKQVKLLWQHQMDEPIGVFDRIFEDHKGLYVEGRLQLEVRRAQEAYALLKSGALEGLSIGYKPVSYDIDSKTGVRHLKEVDLFEVSLVTFPANAEAGVTVVKQSYPADAAEFKEWQAAKETGQLIALQDALDQATAILRQ